MVQIKLTNLLIFLSPLKIHLRFSILLARDEYKAEYRSLASPLSRNFLLGFEENSGIEIGNHLASGLLGLSSSKEAQSQRLCIIHFSIGLSGEIGEFTT